MWPNNDCNSSGAGDRRDDWSWDADSHPSILGCCWDWQVEAALIAALSSLSTSPNQVTKTNEPRFLQHDITVRLSYSEIRLRTIMLITHPQHLLLWDLVYKVGGMTRVNAICSSLCNLYSINKIKHCVQQRVTIYSCIPPTKSLYWAFVLLFIR